MTDTSCVVILYVVFCAVYLVYGETRSQTFYMHTGKRCVSKSASLTARSNIGCCRACLEVDACTMVSFDNSSKTCELSETDTHAETSDAFVEEAGWNVYYKKAEVADLGCLEGWVASENSCFFLDTERRTRSEAVSHCESLKSSAHLVYVKSEDKQTFITGWLQNESLGAHVWLGAMSASNSEEHAWSDGTPFGYTFWYMGEPNHLDELCVGALYDANFRWFDVSCSYLSYGVCEYTLN